MAEGFLFHSGESMMALLAGLGTMKVWIVLPTLALFGLGF